MGQAGSFGMIALRHAIENGGGGRLDDEAIAGLLRGGGGEGRHLRAVFGDASLQVLADAAAACGVSRATMLAAYAAAKASAAAANPELDAAMAEAW